MASLKEIKSRIASIQSTHKITSAMKMVAAAKLHKSQDAIERMFPYQRQMNKILRNFLSGDEVNVVSPYVERREVKRVALILFASNSSLCGAYNSNVIKNFVHVLGEYRQLALEGNVLIYTVGKKAEEAVKKMGLSIAGSYPHLSDRPSYEMAKELAEKLMKDYADAKVDRVELIYHHFKSASAQVLLREQYLPLDLGLMEQDLEDVSKEDVHGSHVSDYIIEPSANELVADLLPAVLKQRMFTAAMDSNASEHAARMIAMQIATDNANELIFELTKQYNKGRQQAITNELLDIIGGTLK